MALAEFVLGVGLADQSRPSVILNDFSEWTLNNNFDEGCSLEFSSRGRSIGAALIQELDTDVFIYKDGVLFQRFRIVSLTQRWGSDGDDVIDVQAVCYRRLLKGRHVITPLTFNNVGQGDIVWGLIQHTQAQPNGDLGITAGSLDNTVTRDRLYGIGENLFDIINDLTRVQDGIAWDIDANLQLIVRKFFDYPLRFTPIELGSTALSLERPSNAENFANVAIVTGDEQATVPVIIGTAGLVQDLRGRWEKVTTLPGEQLQDALDERALGTLDTALSPPSTWKAEISPFRYFSDLELQIGELVALVEPPTIAYRRGPTAAILLQVVDRTIIQTADGEFFISVSGVEITAPNAQLLLAQARLSVLGAAPGQKAVGGEVTSDGQFVYHTFAEAGTFNVLPEFGNVQVEVLVVGGGGGGGGTAFPFGGGVAPCGGAGGGQIVSTAGSPITLNSSVDPDLGAIFALPGAGGASQASGSPSSALTPLSLPDIHAAGGGRGATSLNAATIGQPVLGEPAGGSGGGGSPTGFPVGATAASVVGVGFPGGSYIGTSEKAGGAGGGGAGASGSDTTDAGIVTFGSVNRIGGGGGAGASDSFTGSPTLRGGGGGGGRYFDFTGAIPPAVVFDGAAGGSGGGGAGGGANGGPEKRNGENGIAGTGGGGGGASLEFVGGFGLVGAGGQGGSGLVVIRYLA